MFMLDCAFSCCVSIDAAVVAVAVNAVDDNNDEHERSVVLADVEDDCKLWLLAFCDLFL